MRLRLSAGPFVLLLVGAAFGSVPLGRWQRLEPGLELMRWWIPAYDSTTGGGYCRMGAPFVDVLRIDPNRYRFEVYYYTQLDTVPLTIEEWQSRTGARAVFNAGQYYPDLSYMGLLVSGKERFGKRLHPLWQGLFVAEPDRNGLPKARIIDLKYSRFSPDSTPYTRIAQSFMLFDGTGKKRVKKSDWVANRTAVAEDDKGRIVVLVSEGGLTLWSFADLLQKSRLNLVKAMSMDGGYESALAVKTDKFSHLVFGQWETNDYGDISLPGIKMGLPAVIAVFRR